MHMLTSEFVCAETLYGFLLPSEFMRALKKYAFCSRADLYVCEVCVLYSRVLHTHKKYANIIAPYGGKKDLKKILIKFDNNIQICYIINVGGQYSLFINHQKITIIKKLISKLKLFNIIITFYNFIII